MKVVARWVGNGLHIEVDDSVVWTGFGTGLERIVQVLGALNAEGVFDEFDETEEDKEDDV